MNIVKWCLLILLSIIFAPAIICGMLYDWHGGKYL